MPAALCCAAKARTGCPDGALAANTPGAGKKAKVKTINIINQLLVFIIIPIGCRVTIRQARPARNPPNFLRWTIGGYLIKKSYHTTNTLK
ncbi:MAG: hypothetical protein LBM64_09680 [Deltaproteobacteria bacterium]|nr:hypothetical protein [Deltaproteobacteria bacterium]